MRFLPLPLLLALCTLMPAAAGPLEIYFVDTEGGQATLVVTPAGESVLIDAGHGPRGGRRGVPAVQAGRDAGRIVDAATQAGVADIDYFILTHFHPDHAGGLGELSARLPVRRFVDYGEPMGTPYGPDRMSIGTFRRYASLRVAGAHMTATPGLRLPLEGIEAQIVSAGGAHLDEAIADGGETNGACTNLEDYEEDGTENYRSVGVVFQYGEFRFLDLGDLSGNTLTRLACPTNLIGSVSVFLTPHHGDYDAAVPALYAALRPRVVVMNNGPGRNHGGAREHFRAIRQQPSLEDLWQLHRSRNVDVENAEEDFLANVDDGTTGYAIRLTAHADGSFALTNTRTGFAKSYSKEPAPVRALQQSAVR